MKLDILSVMIILVFSGGMFTYACAIIEYGKSGVLSMWHLAICGILLATAATFTAIIAGKLGLLR